MSRDFDGTSGYLDCGNNTALEGATPMSVGAWVRPDAVAAAGLRAIVSRGSTTSQTRGWALRLNSGAVQFIRRGSAGVQAFSLTVDVWVFVSCTVVLNGSNFDVHFVKVDLDGTVTTDDKTIATTTFANPANHTYVGKTESAANTFFTGGIANIGVWIGDQLSDDELKAYALGGPLAIGRAPTMFLPILGIGTEPDLSGGGSHGTVNGTAPGIDGPFDIGRLAPFQQAAWVG